MPPPPPPQKKKKKREKKREREREREREKREREREREKREEKNGRASNTGGEVDKSFNSIRNIELKDVKKNPSSEGVLFH